MASEYPGIQSIPSCQYEIAIHVFLAISETMRFSLFDNGLLDHDEQNCDVIKSWPRTPMHVVLWYICKTSVMRFFTSMMLPSWSWPSDVISPWFQIYRFHCRFRKQIQLDSSKNLCNCDYSLEWNGPSWSYPLHVIISPLFLLNRHDFRIWGSMKLVLSINGCKNDFWSLEWLRLSWSWWLDNDWTEWRHFPLNSCLLALSLIISV